ncbi:MAG TPA: TatD family hydrolase [Bacteroidales bacterium]|nr:TatD family hydrolase [Bacteroidales bacterium]
MIDTHCHIFLEQFEEDLDEVLNRAADAGVKKIFMPAIDFSSLDQMNGITHDSIELYKMAGLHPCDIEGDSGDLEIKLLEYCSSDDIAAVGETGLDYYWSTDYKKQQKESLNIHCEVAKDTGKPIILHNRESTEDMLGIIEEHQDGRLTGIWHCFNGSVDEGEKAINLGLHLGIGGILTFKNAGVDKTVAKLPIEKMVLETDAPYLAPSPKRGKRNEPAFIRYTAQKLAEVMGMDFDEVDEITTQNALNLFNVSE